MHDRVHAVDHDVEVVVDGDADRPVVGRLVGYDVEFDAEAFT